MNPRPSYRSPYLSPNMNRRNTRLAQTQGAKKRKSFAMKVIKEYTFDSEGAKIKAVEDKARSLKEKEARAAACQVLMEHGVTSSVAHKVARRASKIVKQAVGEVSANWQMQEQWRDELLAYRQRLAVMEQAELARQA